MVLAKRAVSSRIPALMTAGTKLPAFAAQNDSLPSAIFVVENMPETAESNPQARRSRCHDQAVTRRRLPAIARFWSSAK